MKKQKLKKRSIWKRFTVMAAVPAIILSGMPVYAQRNEAGVLEKSQYALDSEEALSVILQTNLTEPELGQKVRLTALTDGQNAGVRYRFTVTRTESGRQYVLRDSDRNSIVWRPSEKEETVIRVEVTDAQGMVAADSVIFYKKAVFNPIDQYPEYDYNTIYYKGDRVQYNGKVYEAQWWTLGGYPGNNEAWKEIDLQTVTPAPKPTSTPIPTPTLAPTSTPIPTATPTPVISLPPNLDDSYYLEWSDEFDGNSLDRRNWTYDIGGGNALWGNNELEYYTDSTDNVSVADGMLTITARQQQKNGFNYTSGRIVTRGLQEFNQGYFEARIKLTNEQGFLPAFWMLGSQGGWPNAGEIDIMEHPNADPACYGAMHWSDANGQVVSKGSEVWRMDGYDASDWHTYGIKWTDEGIVWYVDNKEYFHHEFQAVGDMDEFTRPFYILLNLAVGGDWPGSPDSTTVWPNSMYVDYVRVFKSNGTNAESKPAYPFPQQASYTDGVLYPSNGKTAVNSFAAEFYDLWKNAYVLKDEYVTGEEQYYVWYSGEKYNSNRPNKSVPVTVSEAHGYGMLITAYMAGHDADAKRIFDGMYRYYRAHLSDIGPNLMSWQQSDTGSALIDGAENGSMKPGSSDSAIDGDLDIAYALLLADKQWGSNGEINYKKAALDIIQDIMKYEVDQNNWTLQLGDWAGTDSPGSSYYTATRSSDFMPQHLKEFSAAVNQSNWGKIADKTYQIMKSLTVNGNYQTGLLPDFIVKNGSSYVPANADFLEGELDGGYSYNACRTPWRIGTDYLVNGDADAKAILDMLNRWVRSSTGERADKIKGSYTLDGNAAVNYEETCFTVPFLIAAMCQDKNISGAQQWVDALWSETAKKNLDGYYGDSIKMLCLITAGGGWWSPSSVK